MKITYLLYLLSHLYWQGVMARNKLKRLLWDLILLLLTCIQLILLLMCGKMDGFMSMPPMM